MTRRGRMAVGIGVVAVAIVVVVGLVAVSGGDDAEPIAAVAAVQDDHLPVDPLETIPDRIRMVADTGVTTTRVDIFWGKVARTRPEDPRNPADPAYDFSRPDLILQGFAARGITPIVSVYDTPDWASGGVTQPPGPLPDAAFNRLAPDPGDFGDFMAALATRYSGSFTSPGGETLPRSRATSRSGTSRTCPASSSSPAGTTRACRCRTSPTGGSTPTRRWSRPGYAAVKEANPEATVIAGVGGPRSSTSRTGVGAVEWLRGPRRPQIPLDAYSQHVYPAAPPLEETSWCRAGARSAASSAELDAFRPGLDLYITEAGYTTAATPFRDDEGDGGGAGRLPRRRSTRCPSCAASGSRRSSGSTSRTT